MLRIAYDLVLLTCAILAATASNGASDPAQPKIPVPTVPSLEVDPKMPYFLVCAQACDDCARHCELCAAHCAKMLADGKKEHLETVRLCQDCAAFCQATARITAKDGPMKDLITMNCADACKRCGDACEKHAHDPIMKRCAEECRKCEKVCKEMHKLSGAIAPIK